MLNPHARQHGLSCRRQSGFALLAVVASFCLAAFSHCRADQFDTLRAYWLNSLVGTNLSSSTLNSRAGSANSEWSSMNTNASRTYLWSDLPFGSVSANITSTYGRLNTMALAWASPGCSLYGNTNLAAAINGGLDWMAANVYSIGASEYNNWWDWEIGSPQSFNNTVVMMYPALTGTEITNYNNSVDHFSPPTTSWDTGANLTDKVKVVLIRGIIGKSSAKMTLGQTNLSSVFPYVTTSDGFYLDGSFIQHSDIAYTGTYGDILLGDVAELVNLLNGSTWQITDPNLTNVYNWVTASYEPVIYHGVMMDMLRGRAISRYEETESSDGSGAVSNIRQVAEFAPAATATAFNSWANSPYKPPGQYQFADMDRVVAWRSNFCFGLSMSSSRIANYESINGENLHGWFTGDGMTYLYLGNTETQFGSDFWPTVDAYHLPGTTVEELARANAAGEATKTSQNWVGGADVSGAYGVAGMSLAAYNTSLVGKKSWFMFDNEMVCLGAGITCGGGYEVDTTVENRQLGTSPTNNFWVNGVKVPPSVGWSSNLTSASWCALDGVAGYYFPGGATNLLAQFVANTGAWSNINNGTYVATTTNPVTDDYLQLWFNHGNLPTNSTYAYVIVPNATASTMNAYAASPDIVVLTNTATVQAASKPSIGVVAANFWTAGTNSASLITVNQKASVITSETTLGLAVGIADPTQTNTGSILVTLNRAGAAVLSADPGVTVLQLAPQIVLSVNVNGSLGKTFQASFSYPAAALTWDANTSAGGTHPLDGSGVWDSGDWWNGSADMTWSDTLPYIAEFGAGGVAGTVTSASPHNAVALVFNPVASGAYTLNGSGPLTVSNGITADASATLDLPLTLAASQTWTVSPGQTLAVNGPIGDGGGGYNLTEYGGGILTLAGTNTYSGGTTLIGGTLNVAGPMALPASSLAFGNVTSVVINLNGFSQVLTNLTFGNSASVITFTGTAGSSLTIPSFTNLYIAPAWTSNSLTLNLSGLSAFEFTNKVGTFSVRNGFYDASVAGNNTVTLAAGTNIITAENFGVGDFNDSGGIATSTLNLGAVNVINANNLNIGSSGSRPSGAVRFAAGLANPVLTIAGAGGAGSTAVLTLGSHDSYQASDAPNDLFDTTPGTLNAQFGSVTIGQAAPTANSNGRGITITSSLKMGAGTLTASSMTVGNIRSQSNVTNDTIKITALFSITNGGAAIITNLTVANNSLAPSGGTANTLTLSGTVSLTNGATLEAATIQKGAAASTAAFTNQILWGDGTIGNIPGGGLNIGGVNVILAGVSTTHNFGITPGQIGTVTSPISGTGALACSGGGTLMLWGTNTYTGTTTVGGGTLLVNGSIGTNLMTVAPGAVLGGSGSVAGPVSVQAGGMIQNGPGNFAVAALNLGNNNTAVTASQFTLSAGGWILATNLNVNGTNTINVLDNNVAMGTNTLFACTGAIGGSSGFGGFKLGALPAGMAAYLQTNGSLVQLVVSAPPVLMPVATFNTGACQFSFSGADGRGYRVLCSTNLSGPLSNWLLLASGTFGTGVVTYTDIAATNGQRFYRIASP